MFSAALLKSQLEPTVVHRAQFKSRPSVISFDKDIIELTPESSPSNSAESSSNGSKSTVPRQSTGKTSHDSKFSAKSKAASQHSSDHKKAVAKQTTAEGGSNENVLTPIAEVEAIEPPEPVPSKSLPYEDLKTVLSSTSYCHSRESCCY
jgi:protein-serine/threonine kinase